ncbi:MAG TPA: phospholipase D-like domain-containing protein [Steroidobacteraceae bacterium]|nr:phospholipase D-like domain-containing protein [Steroidobacteraceae bacterium]
MAPRAADRHIDRTIATHLHRLRKPGVLTVRPGYEIAGHQLTGRRAIVATVHTKKPLTDLRRGAALPQLIGGIPVDVREASAYQRLRASDPLAAEVSQIYRRPEDAEPHWPLERELPSGKPLKSASSAAQRKLRAQLQAQPTAARALSAHREKPELAYEPRGCPPLESLAITARVTTAVSPDAGLVTLARFLGGTRSSLSIGMYDFTSAEILRDVQGCLAAPGTLQLVLDDPAPNPTRDQTDAQTVQDLRQALGGRASIAWALTRSDPFASAWLFPSAYHIKVIVRDGSAVWLSSGNLNRSNEPDPSDPPSTEDRDWHVVVEDPALAGVFTAYLNYDHQQAADHQLPDQPAIARAIEDAHAKRAAQTNPAPPADANGLARGAGAKRAPIAPGVFDDLSLRITPLLTPDRLPGGQQGQYLARILGLIRGARDCIHIQMQYIEASAGDGSPYDGLLQAIADQVAAHKDVRLIVSANYAEKWGEKMRDQGVDLTASIRTLPNVHNKGFVIDAGTVVVSSQNFSPAGVGENRDAGLILESAQIAGYFAPIFARDWDASRPLVAPAPIGQGKARRQAGSTRRPRRRQR